MKLTCCIIFTFFLTFETGAQKVVFPIKNYTTKDYGRDFHPANMAIVQDQRGIIYAANGFKLLEFDGHTWNSYPINKEAWILSLAVDRSGIIYAGSQNEFGYFKPDSRGELKYHSLSDSLDITDSEFTNIWKVHAFSGGVVFQAEEKLFLYINGKTEVINPVTSFHTSFIVNDILYVRQRGTGLMEWKENNMVKINGSEIFDTTGVFLMLPFGRNNKKILIGTQEKGFWLFEPEGLSNRFRKFNVDDLSLLEKAKITGGVLTGDGSYAISTMLNGMIVIDTAGKTRALINSENGLSDNEVKQVISDQSKNLWLALNNGISTIEISSPLSVYSEKNGIPASITALKRYRNLLYVGTGNGLFVQQQDNESGTQFVPVPNLSVPVRCLIEAEGWLFAGTDAGLFQLSGNSIRKISNEESYTLLYSPNMKLLLSGGPKGMAAFRYEGSFEKLEFLKDIREDIIGIAGENRIGGDSTEFWIGTRYNGAIRIEVSKNLTLNAERYTSSDGLPGGPVTPYDFNSKTVFGTSQGLYEFINESIVKETLPDSLKNNKDFLKGYFSTLPVSNDTFRKSVSTIVENSSKIWICSDNQAGYLDKNNDLSYVSKPFRGINVGKINIIYPEENGICWLGTTDGLFRYNGNTSKNYNTGYSCLIRKVTLMNNDSVLFLGTNYEADSGYFKVVLNQTAILKPVLSYRNNSLRFDFTAPFYEFSDKMFFSFQLEGNDSRWTQWTPEFYQEYTNLREGDYIFRVKARNVYGTESTQAQYSFTVLPPWYRSVTAYVSYLISALILMWLIARIYSYRLKRENIRLEGIVAERTSEVVRQKDEIENKNTVLEYQKKEIEDSIRYALRIQSAVIPSEKFCIDFFPESFVFFRPLNIVSGDFYWISHVENKIIFTAADCTGHGVPGAFMSMLGVAFLNEIVNKDHLTEPDAILNHLRDKVIDALQQQGISGEARDGMDIAIVCVDEKEKKLKYAGAYNPLIIIRNGEIIETGGDKMPIGIYEKMAPFTRHEIPMEDGDVFYMASDGYEDQFGGPEGKKLKSKKFKQLLLEIHKYPMKSQKEIIEKRFEEWKGDLKQVDDIVVIGVRL
jgi:serine phosphatase RsbU (regulator of sigma subunit)/ligand-binding sensor domain-containing protein